MGEVFADGEPVDPKKLQSLQNQIDEIKIKSDESYNLSKTTAGDVATLGVLHLRAGVVSFENGLTAKAKYQSQDIDLNWGPEYTVAFVVASPRLQNPQTSHVRWSLSGSGIGNTTKLNAYAETNIGGPLNFHWISAAHKPS